MSAWIDVKDKKPPTDEPIVYVKPKDGERFCVGIAYWTVSKKWKPEMESTQNLSGFTHWMPLPEPPL